MRSSISSSELDSAGALDTPIPIGPASPKSAPGPSSMANPDRNASRGRDRSIPDVPWLRMLIATAAGLFVLLFAWEVGMRQLGLRAGDLDDGRAHWAAERRKVDTGPRDSVVLIGDSRMLFDTDLATWQTLTGRRPIQLALPATNAQPFLHDLAVDEHFAGLVVIGTAEIAYFRAGSTFYASVLDYIKTESPTKRIGHQIHKQLSRYLAFLDSNYTPFSLIEQNDWPERPGVFSAYQDVWKISESYDDRQTYLWDRIERDAFLRGHVQRVWSKVFSGEPLAPEVIARAIANTKSDIDRIRARGGEVVWVRPPSAEPILGKEHVLAPRDKVWDRLLRDTGSVGVHFEDYPQMQHLSVPDGSHLSRSSAVTFTDAYVRVLLDRVGWLKAHAAEETSADPR